MDHLAAEKPNYSNDNKMIKNKTNHLLNAIIHKTWLYAVLISLSCNSQFKPKLEQEVEVIEAQKRSILKFSSFVERIEYFVLPDDLPIRYIDKVMANDELYFLCDFYFSMGVVILDKNFEHIGTVKNFGEGPKEYPYIRDVTINNDLNTIDILSLTKILRFDFNGDFLEEFRIPIQFTNFQHLKKDDYMIYIPSYFTEGLANEELSGFVLFNWDSGKNLITPVIPQHYKNGLPAVTDNNILSKWNNDCFFSMTYSDTIYCLNEDNHIKRKYVLDFGKGQFPVELLSKYNVPDKQYEERIKPYSFQRANLYASDKYIITTYIDKNGFSPIIYNRDTKLSLYGTISVNDIDHGSDKIVPKLLKNNVLYSFYESDILLSYYEYHIEKLTEVDNEFTKLVRGLDKESSPLVITKYFLK
ncbi:6-bladed beta-propeller [Negadavirga shengliensis]|uniref:6-bladed beta-propeller n=1 Tax=Negadavirga shengliensis TaxID=1389218 RepID=A0ABV9T5U8_9BACT